MILTILGYLVLTLLAWVGGYVLIFTASRAWHDGKAQAKSDTIKEIRRLVWSASLNTNEIVTVLQGNTDRTERILTVTDKFLDVTGEMNRAVGHLLNMEIKRGGEYGGGDLPVPPTLVG